MKWLPMSVLFLLAMAMVLSGCGNGPEEEGSDQLPENPAGDEGPGYTEPAAAKLLYQGHGSFRITTSEGKVIYVDPYAGEGYDMPADLILVTHQHPDHNQVDLIETQNAGCITVSQEEALEDGSYKIFDFGYVTVEAVEAYNDNHDPAECVGFIMTLSDGISIYASGDTSKTEQMETLAQWQLDYAFFCCDGRYNMDIDEASECADLVAARHSIPYHVSPGELFDRERAELFRTEGRLIVEDGEEIELV